MLYRLDLTEEEFEIVSELRKAQRTNVWEPEKVGYLKHNIYLPTGTEYFLENEYYIEKEFNQIIEAFKSFFYVIYKDTKFYYINGQWHGDEIIETDEWGKDNLYKIRKYNAKKDICGAVFGF